jgi:RNA polymerase sigma factor (sigma-70 family)
MTNALEPVVLSDAELIAATRAGDETAFAELYVRHQAAAYAAARSLTRRSADVDDVVADAFTRVLNAIRKGGGPEVAFRPYLLTAVRNAFYDTGRRGKKVDVVEDVPEDPGLGALLTLETSSEDKAMIASAFTSLPERWQLVLWHTEVEGRSPAEIAPLLGMAPNAVAALSYRAREGLREAYLQAHLSPSVPANCRDVTPKLGAYVRGGLSARDRRMVESHLDTCDRCPLLIAELVEANHSLRAVMVPLVVGVPAAMYLGAFGAGGKFGLALLWRRFRLNSSAQVAAGVAAVAVSAVVAVGIVAAAGGGDRRGSDASTTTTGGPGITTTLGLAASTSGGSGQGTGSVGATSGREAPESSSPGSTVEPSEAPTSGPPTTPAVPTTVPPELTAPPTGTTPSGPLPTVSSSTVGSSTIPATTSAPGTTRRPVTTSRPATTRPGTSAATTVGPTTSVPTPPTTIPPTPPPTAPPTEPPPPPTTVPPPTTTPPPEPPDLSLALSQVGPVISGQRAYIRARVGNGSPLALNGRLAGAGVASSPVVDIDFPAGSTFVAADGPWTCVAGTASVSCGLPALGAGASSTAVIEVELPAVTGGQSFSGSVSEPGFAGAAAAQIDVDVVEIDGMDFYRMTRGGVEITGNTVLTCDLAATSSCEAARSASAVPLGNNRQNQRMVRIDVDTDSGTDTSSSALLTLPEGATVLRAVLVWSGDLGTGSGRANDPDQADTVELVGPAGRVTVDGAIVVAGNDPRVYKASADVTSTVSAAGWYTVAGMQVGEGIGTFGGWSLLVAYHDDDVASRAITMFEVFDLLPDSATYSIAGLPAITDRAVHEVMFAVEGDFDFETESLRLNGATVDAPNAFRSRIDANRSPAYVNNFAVDVRDDRLAVAGQSTEVTITATSGSPGEFGERVRICALAVAFEV